MSDPTFLTQTQAFAAYKKARDNATTVRMRITDQVAGWLLEKHLGILTAPFEFEKDGDEWVLKVGKTRAGKPISQERLALEALAPGEAKTVEFVAQRLRTAAANITRQTGVRYSVRELEGGKALITRADANNALAEPSADDKYGLAAMAVGDSKVMPDGVNIIHVRAATQYQRMRWGRTYSVRSIATKIHVTRNT